MTEARKPMAEREPCIHEREGTIPFGRFFFLTGLPCAECAAEEHAAWEGSVRARLLAGLQAAAAGEPFAWDPPEPEPDPRYAPVCPGVHGEAFDEIALDPPQPPAPLTLEETYELLRRHEAAKKIMACAPDVYERVREQVHGSGLGAYCRVQECPWLDDGQVVVIDPALLQPPPLELPDDWAAPKHQCSRCLRQTYGPHCVWCELFTDAFRAPKTGLAT